MMEDTSNARQGQIHRGPEPLSAHRGTHVRFRAASVHRGAGRGDHGRELYR